MTTTKRRIEAEKIGVQNVEPVLAPAHARNPGMPLDMDWVRQVRVNRSAVERRAATISTRRTVKLEEITASVQAGAREIDIVISRAHVLTGNWQGLYDEVRAFRAACGDAHMKTILATHELATLRNVDMASLVCMMAGADFIKTSTGKEPVNATLPVGVVMVRAIREYFDRTGYKVGFKPAGGIRSAKQSLDWLILMKEELGNEWLHNSLFRIGASSLLSDIERQLSYFATGHYAAAYHNPMV